MKNEKTKNQWWTGAQFASFISGFDESKLRRLGREINLETNAPWIPKPRDSKFEFTPTLKGVIAYLISKQRDGLPTSFDSMQAMNDSSLGTPLKFISWALKNGAGEARIGGSRINPRPILTRANEILESFASGGIGKGETKVFDKNTEQAKLANIQAQTQEIDLELKNQRIHDLNEIDRLVKMEIVAPLRDGLHNLQKKYARLKSSKPDIAQEILETDLPALLKKLSEIK